jgi:hypothetical protein
MGYLLDESLVGEVGFVGKGDQSLDEGGEGDVVSHLGLDVGEVGLDLLDLDEGWVGELTEETKALIDGGNGFVVLFNGGLEGGVLVLSLGGLGGEVFAVLVDVGGELVEVGSDSVSLGDQDVVNEVVSVEEVYKMIGGC